MREALKTVRAAAASAASSAASAASSAASSTRSGSGAGSGSGSGGGRPPRASVTDVVPRRTLVIIAVVVALAVVAAILGFALSGGDAGNSAATGKDIEATAAQTHASPGGGKSGAGQGTPSGQTPSAPASGDGAGDGKDKGGKKDELPAGYANVTNGQFHFRVAMPKGWHRTGTAGQSSGAIFSKDGGYPRIQIDYNASPGQDAAAAWRKQEPAVSGTTPDYHRISIKSVDWRDYPTVADWSFTRTSHGQKVRVLDRGFRADDDHGYAIMITCKADAWSGDDCKKLRDTAFATFAIKD
jgi:hypothetical protein